MKPELRPAFYEAIKKPLFGGHLTPNQAKGMERLLDRAWAIKLEDPAQLGYVLATDYRETGAKMMPVPEIGRGKGKPYGRPDPHTGLIYYGRGDVQLTWYQNYLLMQQLLGVPLVAHPELALEPTTSAMVIFEGMLRGHSNRGDFTGKSLEDYVAGKKRDFVNARRTVNGLDHAQEIADHAKTFTKAAEDAGMKGGEPWTDHSTRSLQQALTLLGYKVKTDGAYGPGTTTAVTNFQLSHGLRADGIAGEKTWFVIDSLLPK
jgi:putative chitinase